MRLTNQDVQEMRDSAGKIYVQLPSGAKLFGASRPMNESERLAVANLMAAARLLNSMGCVKEGRVDDLDPELEQPDSDPETE
jgi:hypothetical protein